MTAAPNSLLGSPRVSLRTQLCIQETKLIQFALLDFIGMGLHFIHVPVDTQVSTFEEVRLGRGQPKRNTPRERLLILREWREHVDDRAAIVSRHQAGMDGEEADVGAF